MIRFYLETSERSMETHAVQMPVEAPGQDPPVVVFPDTVCGHGLDGTWEPARDSEKQPWPTCSKCYDGVVQRGWWPHNLDLPATEDVPSDTSGHTKEETQ